MKLIGMMLARDEAWCIGLTARVALAWCDELIVLDHRSADSTPEILREVGGEHPGRLVVIREDERPFNEAEMRQRMLEAARARGMTHGAIIDADELLTANLLERARGFAENARAGEMPHIPMRSPHGSMLEHRVDAAFGDKWISVWYRDEAALEYRAAADGYHYHARRPMGLRETYMHLEKFGAAGGCWHLQTISRRRLEVKAACYKVLERVHFPGRHSASELNAMYDWAINARAATSDTPPEWLVGYEDLVDRHLDLESEPWQLGELRELLTRHPRELFKDLDLRAVA